VLSPFGNIKKPTIDKEKNSGKESIVNKVSHKLKQTTQSLKQSIQSFEIVMKVQDNHN